MQALEVSHRLARRGHAVWLACPVGGRLEQEASARDMQTLPVRADGYFHPRIMWKVSQFLQVHGIQVIHCQLSRDIATISPALKLARRPIPLLLSKRVGSYVSKRDVLHRFTYSSVTRVLAVSDVIRRNVIETTPVPAARVITLHDAVDTEVFSLERADGAGVRREFGFGPETLVVGFVGRFSPGKGHEELLAAASQIAPKHPQVRFLVVGEASYKEHSYERKIRSMARSLGLDSVMRFTGFRKDVPSLMAAFDIFAFPSHAESFGLVLIEAMAMERPVVSTNCDGVLDIVIDGGTGMYVRPKDSDDLAAGLTRLIGSPALRRAMGKAGRTRVLQLFDQRKQVDRLEALYRELLITPQGASPPAPTPSTTVFAPARR